MTATLQEQARALGDPTRYAIFRRVADAGRPIGIAELNEHFALNHNAIRQHLTGMVAAGLVGSEIASNSPPALPLLSPNESRRTPTLSSSVRCRLASGVGRANRTCPCCWS